MRRAVLDLVQEGLLTRGQGKGTFVAESYGTTTVNGVQSFTQELLEHAVSAVWPKVAHGAGMASLMPYYLKQIAAHDHSGKLARFAVSVLGVEPDADAAAKAGDALREFCRGLGLPGTLRELVGQEPTEEDLKTVASKSLPWGPMQAGCYPDYTEENVAALFRMAN